MVRVPRRTRASRDEGSVLVLVLVMMIVGALLVLPILSYSMTVLRANSVVTDKARRQEAVKAGLRVALTDPLRLYEHCHSYAGGQLWAPSINSVDVDSRCEIMTQASAQESHDLHLGVAVTKVGSVVPWNVAAVPVLDDDDLPILDEEGVPLRYVYEQGTLDQGPIDRWWKATEEPAPEHLATPLVEPRHIWAPNLPSQPVETRISNPTGASAPAGYLMPGGYSVRDPRECRVFFPGVYSQELVLDRDIDYFFTSGVYYFRNSVTISGNADVVVGMGTYDGCVTDQEAAFHAVNSPVSHGISGLGATFVFGTHPDTATNGRLTIKSSGNDTPTVRFNQRYVHPVDVPGYASYGVSIVSVNGWVDEFGNFTDLSIPYNLSVPVSKVGGVELPYDLDDPEYEGIEIPSPGGVVVGTTSDDYKSSSYYPSALTYLPGPPTLDDEWANDKIAVTPFRTGTGTTDGGLRVQWEHLDPEDWGGTPIDSYYVRVVRASTGTQEGACTWNAPAEGEAEAPLDCVFTGLASPDNTSERYSVLFTVASALGSTPETAGGGDESGFARINRGTSGYPETPVATTLDLPQNVDATPYFEAIQVSWDPPANADALDFPITRYEVYRRTGASGAGDEAIGCTVTNPTTSAQSCVVRGLSASAEYRFCVRAVSLTGLISQASYPDGAACPPWPEGTEPVVSIAPSTLASDIAPDDPEAPAPSVYPPFPLPAPAPDPILHIDLSEDDDDDCAGYATGGTLDGLVAHMRDLDAADDVVVQIPGYIALPQGLVQVDNPCARSRISTTGGLLAADIAVNGPPVPGGDQLTVAIGIENPLVQRTVKIVAITGSGTPVVRGTAVVQINETGEYSVNSWEIQ